MAQEMYDRVRLVHASVRATLASLRGGMLFAAYVGDLEAVLEQVPHEGPWS